MKAKGYIPASLALAILIVCGTAAAHERALSEKNS
jgi:hypothetical protein